MEAVRGLIRDNVEFRTKYFLVREIVRTTPEDRLLNRWRFEVIYLF